MRARRLGRRAIGTSALADLLLVEGNSRTDIDLLVDPQQNLTVIMKDGVIYKSGWRGFRFAVDGAARVSDQA
jgi:imidazolonepropionase-like amidohydrolase